MDRDLEAGRPSPVTPDSPQESRKLHIRWFAVLATLLMVCVYMLQEHVTSFQFVKQLGYSLHRAPARPGNSSLFRPPVARVPANAKRHDVSEVIKFHGQSVASATSNFVMFDVDSAMFSWLKTKGEQFVQEIGSLTIEAGIIALKRTRRRSQASKPRPQGHLRFKATQFKVNCRARLHYCTTTCTRTASGHLPPDAGYNLPGGHVAK